MEYIVTKVLKESDKGIVELVRKTDEEKTYVRKILKGRHPVYGLLQGCEQPYLPKIYEVVMSDDSTVVIEEYIEGYLAENAELSEKQFLNYVKELCSVLNYVHEKGIIHRDIKPSNIIVANDGHIRLIDFDVARIFKESVERDTTLMGTRGYAPPEQYGFTQTDERSDIYALGVTLEQFLRNRPYAKRYRKMIRKCTNTASDKRYQSAKAVEKSFFHTKQRTLYICMAVLTVILVCGLTYEHFLSQPMIQSQNTVLEILPMPGNPHWDGETGIALWEHVSDSGFTEDDEAYHYRVYRRDRQEDIPNPQTDDDWVNEGDMSSNQQSGEPFFYVNLNSSLAQNGYYYFVVYARGDGENYSDSAYAVSDVFHYTGENAPHLPEPTGLAWNMYFDQETSRLHYYAIWENLDEYEDTDSFNVTIYDKKGDYVFNNIWTKKAIITAGHGGILIRPQFLTKSDEEYRFTVQALTSRPNEYSSSPKHDTSEEEFLSPPFTP